MRSPTRRPSARAAAVLLACLLALVTVPGAVAAPTDPYRPVYHYTPRANFMNDPNGLVYHDGRYHLFYQHNPSGPTAGNGSWGHATSPDLVRWTEQPLAIPADAQEDVWSGSVVLDRTNSSGFGTAADPPLVAVYTSFHRGDGVQRQSLAYSRDDGTTWTKYAGNPVLDIGSRDFRDPKVSYDPARGRWVMVVALAADKKVSVYTSTDLKAWTHRSDFGPAGTTSSVWECPDLFPLDADGGRRWVLTVSVAGHTQYFVGDFDGSTFTSPDAAYTAPPATRVLGDFEGPGYDGWTTTGTAFGSGPVVPGPDVANVSGRQVADSFGGSDTAVGTLTSPPFTVDAPYLNLLLGGGRHPYVENASEAPPAGEVFADFEGPAYGPGWTATGDLAGTGPSAPTVPGKVGDQVLDTCVRTCDPATGTLSSPEFTLTRDWLNLLVAGGRHPWGEPRPTAVNLVVDGAVVASATGQDSADLDWTAWDTSAYRGRTAHLEVIDQRTADWGHLLVDHVVFSDTAARPWARATAATLLVDGRVVHSATGDGAPGLDWRSWDLSDLQGKQARVQLVDQAVGGWGHLLADRVYLSGKPALDAAARTRWVDHGNDDYAGVTFNDAPGGRRVSIGWMSNWDYADVTPTGSWRGQQTVARRLTLSTRDGRPTLVQTPVPLTVLTRGTARVGRTPLRSATVPLRPAGRALRVDAVLSPGSAARSGLDVRTGRGQRTRIGYDQRRHELYVDRTRSGASGFSAAFAGVHRAPLDLHGRPLALTVLVDSSSVEVFADGGRVTISDLVYPDPASTGLAAFAEDGSATLERALATTLGPAVRR